MVSSGGSKVAAAAQGGGGDGKWSGDQLGAQLCIVLDIVCIFCEVWLQGGFGHGLT